jgi:hypothetical protein
MPIEQATVDALNGEFDLRQEALKREGFAGYASEQDYYDAAAHLRATLTRWVRARPELREERIRGEQQLPVIAFLVKQLGAKRAPWLSVPDLRAHFAEWVPQFKPPSGEEHWTKPVLAIIDLVIQGGTSITGCPFGLAQADVDDFLAQPGVDDPLTPWITDPRRALFEGAELEAARLFLLVLRSPYWVGECHCGRWFLNVNRQVRRSCTRRHAQALVNQRHNPETKKKLQAERDEEKQLKLELARAAVAEYERRRPDQDWKAWVAAHVSRRITKNFLTYVVNEGLLRPPKMKGALKR